MITYLVRLVLTIDNRVQLKSVVGGSALKVLLYFWTFLATFSIQIKAVEIEVLTEDAYPFHYRQGDEVVGTSTALVKQVLDEAGLNYTIKIQPWARIYNSALHRKNTLIFSLARTKQREPLFYWLGAITEVNYYLYGLAETKIDPNAPVSVLNNYRIAVVRETATHHYLESKKIKNVHLTGEGEQNIQMLLNDRIDLLAGELSFFYEDCKRVKLDCSKIKPLYKLQEPSTEFYFAMNKTTDINIVNRIKAAYQKVMNKK